MNRIYQGKINKVELLDTEAVSEKGLPLGFLSEHHQLFQDAINYYLTALAAMASDEASPLGKMRQRMKEEAWKEFDRAGRSFGGLRQSLLRSGILGANREATFDEAITLILAKNPVSEKVLQLAADSLIHDLGGDSAIQKGGRQYFPYFCSYKTAARFPRSSEALAKAKGKEDLPYLLHDPEAQKDYTQLLEKLTFGFFANPNPSGEMLMGDVAKSKLGEALDYLKKTHEPDSSSWTELSAKLKDLKEIEFPAYTGGSINKEALKHRFYAYLVFRFIEPSDFTFQILRDSFPAPKKPKKADDDKPDEIETLLCSLGEDPIKLARGSRGYVFPAFTSLPIFGSAGPEEIKWSEFDIAAFKEALKTVNQFRLKAEEREARRQKFLDAIRYMEGKINKWVDPEGAEDSDPPARIQNDPRVALTEQLIRELKQDLELTDIDSDSITLASRRLRGWSALVEQFNKKVEPGEPFTETKAQALKTVLSKHQTEHRDDVGDVRLFETLITKAVYWPLWQAPTTAEKKQRDEQDWSNSFLKHYHDYLEFKEEAERLKDPIRFTPADAQESRRLYMFSDLGGRSKVKHHADNLSMEVSIALHEGDDIWRERRVRLHYSAPRLRRDHLRAVEGPDNLTAAPWLQPMMEALGLPEPMPQKIASHAVALMPEPGREGMRFLLNFPINLESENLIEILGRKSLWKGQFNGTNEKHIHLHWPQTMDPKHHANAWWKRETSFTTLAVDLGTRACASVVLMECARGTAGPLEHEIGRADGQQWKAKRSAPAQLKLAGENMRVLDGKEWKEEPFGSKGRPADPSETYDYERWLGLFEVEEESYLRSDVEHLSFPEQNDRMLRMFRRGQGRNMQLNRWLRFLNEGDPKRQDEIFKEINELGNDELKKCERHQVELLKGSLKHEILKQQDLLKKEVVLLANRILPLRGRQWEWAERASFSQNWILRQTAPGTAPEKVKIRGQRGLSVMRIEQIEELRRRLQSLNRALQREPGVKAKMGRPSRGMEIPDPCPDIAEKLEALKEQRTNQTAHLILAQALGVQLKSHVLSKDERRLRDVHGEYEIIPGRKPVDFIVLEDLSRYRTSQDRGPSENSRLMQWCHRAVTAKLKELCEPYGIPVLETPAAYTSKFCSKTGIAGFRAREILPGQTNRMGRKQKESKEYLDLEKQFAEITAGGRNDLPLIVPARGGPLFITMQDKASKLPLELVQDADLNAACNLALRAVAAPDAHSLLPRLRCRWENGHLHFIGSIKNPKPSKRDEKRFEHDISFTVQLTKERAGDEDDEAESGRACNVFIDLGRVADFERIENDKVTLPLATGKGLWGTIKQNEFAYCIKLNNARIQKWREAGKLLPADDIQY